MNAGVSGMTTLPAIAPGEPVCHLGKLPDAIDLDAVLRRRMKQKEHTRQLIDQLSTNVLVVERPNEPEKD
jgi:hypothetical protein